jgi:hypothetical protein
MEGVIRIIWQGRVKNKRQIVLGRYETTVGNVLRALSGVGMDAGDFNKMITGVSVGHYPPPHLFIKGSSFASVAGYLYNHGLATKVGARSGSFSG